MSVTRHLFAENLDDLADAAALLRSGKLVAFATETVYGLGANALDATAVASIFAAKKRPAWDPLIVHLDAPESIRTVTEIPDDLQPRVDALMAAFWPGPLTLLLPRASIVPDAVTAGRTLIGVRVPAHPAAAALLKLAAVPVAAPSANTFGHTSPTTAAHVLDDLDGRIDAVLDAGPTTIGVESTVLDPTQTPMLLYRPGAVTAEQIMAVTGIKVVNYVLTTETKTTPSSLPSPGVGIRHYAPRARLILSGDTAESLERMCASVLLERESVAVLAPADWNFALHHADVTIFSWADWSDDQALAATLFGMLRSMDQTGVDVIVCPMPKAGGLRDAIRDRLTKAARTL